VAVTDPRTAYLLPCACGREIVIETQQAGETVQCECGRICPIPTMREIQRLRPASTGLSSAAPSAAENRNWGNSQRLLVAGGLVCLLAVIAAVIVYRQLPARMGGLPTPEEMRQRIGQLSPQQTRQFFHEVLLPGIEFREQAEFQSHRTIVYLGLGTAAAFGAIGLILVGSGVMGMVRRRT
jgi:hypothetical protein